MAVSAAIAAATPFIKDSDVKCSSSVFVSGEGAPSRDSSHGRCVITRCITIIKDTNADIYGRGIAVLTLGLTLGRDLGRKHARGTPPGEDLRKECGGVGGVLDSLLDIVGQCTPSKEGNAPALSAGCGIADAKKIRSNCFALISLLVALLAEARPTGITASADRLPKRSVDDQDDHDWMALLSSTPPGVIVDGFVAMNPNPSPDVVVRTTEKKGWAARQALLQSSSAGSARNSRQTPLACARTRQAAHHRGNADGLDVPQKRQTILDSASVAKKTSASRIVHHPSRNKDSALPVSERRGGVLAGQSGSLPFVTAINSAFAKSHEELTSPAQKSSDKERKVGEGVWTSTLTKDDHRGLERKVPRSIQSVAQHIFSPPRLRQRRMVGSSVSGTLKDAFSPTREAIDDPMPLGLSDHGLGKRRRPAKIWHKVSVTARNASVKNTGVSSPPAITLSAELTVERFASQPDVRPAVLFGSAPAHEVQMSKVCCCDTTDVFAIDTTLGYQIPRLWFSQDYPGHAGVGYLARSGAWGVVEMPQPRARPSRTTGRPIGSDGVVWEYQQMQTFQAYSAIARTRPSRDEPLHGVNANSELVKTLGKRPEEEDAAIGMEWSPRGGRKVKGLPKARRRRKEAVERGDIGYQGKDSEICRGRNSLALLHPRSCSSSPSRDPCNRVVSAAAAAHSRTWEYVHRPQRVMSRSLRFGGEHPFPVHRENVSALALHTESASRSLAHQSSGSDRRPHVTEVESMSHSCGDDAIPSRAGNEGAGGEDALSAGASCLGATTYRPSSWPSTPPIESLPLGNLGGRFVLPESPYRTYISKHARLVRARSSDRLAERKRQAKKWGELEPDLQRRSRSAGSTRSSLWQGGSGITSPLLRAEGFGIIESSVTGKIALGMQLPRDQSSASGRARTTAIVEEQAFKLAYDFNAVGGCCSRRKKQTVHECSSWLHVHQGDLLSGDCYDERYNGSSPRMPGGGGDRSLRRCYITRKFYEARMRWPSTPKRRRVSRVARRRRSSDDDVRPVLNRNSWSTTPSGRDPYRTSLSWSPQRTRIGSGTSMVDDTVVQEDGWERTSRSGLGEDSSDLVNSDNSNPSERWGAWGRAARYSSRPSSRSPLSPLMVPLDSFRGTRTVMLASTLVSRRDAEAVERSSRKAYYALQLASQLQRGVDNGTFPASSPKMSSLRGGLRGTRGGDLGGCRPAWSALSEGARAGEHNEREIIRCLLSSVASMEQELSAIKRADSAMREEQLAQVQLNMNALPLALLLVHPGGAARARDFVERAMGAWQSERARARLTHAMARWKIECEAQRFQERGLGYRTTFGALKIRRLMKRRRVIVLRTRLATWRAFCRMEIYTARAKATLLIQTQYRRWKAFRSFLIMHYSKPLGGALGDSFLDEERKGVNFKIDTSMRKDRRRYWNASVLIQTKMRVMLRRARYRILKGAATRVQTHFRMWSNQRAYIFLKQKTILAQSFVRMAIWRPKWRRFRVIPAVIQRCVRGHLARQEAHRRRIACYRELELPLGKAVPFQAAWRGFVARRWLRLLRENEEREWQAAVLLQRVWYRHMGQFPAFVLISCLRAMDTADEEQTKAGIFLDRTMAARRLQRVYRQRYRFRRKKAAVSIQSWWRVKIATNFGARLRVERWSSRKLRCWLTACMERRHDASRVIAFRWLKARPGRVLKHLQDRQERDEERWWSAWRESRNQAASRLQAAVRGQRLRQQIRREIAVVLIRRIGLGFIYRRRAIKRSMERKQEHAVSFVTITLEQGITREVYRQVHGREIAGNRLRAWGRGLATRAAMRNAVERVRAELVLAIRIQRAWRKWRGVLSSKRHALSERRNMTNPFNSVTPQVEVVASEAIATASAYFNPRNGPVGCGIWQLCRRLGGEGDVWPVLRAAGITGVEALRGCSDKDLVQMGLVDTPPGNQRQEAGSNGIFEAGKLRVILLRLVCEADPFKPSKEEDRELFEGFDPIQGYPYRQNKIRQMFLEHFGNRFTQRAEYFSAIFSKGGPGERAEITTHQLRRYLGSCGTPAKAKERLQELTRPSPVEHHRAQIDERRRLKLCLSMLSAGADRIRHLYSVPHAEVVAKGGPATKLVEALQRLPETADEEEQRQRGRRAARGDTFEIADHHRHVILAITTRLFDLLYRFVELGPAAKTLQGAYRRHSGRKFVALLKHKLSLERHFDRYLWERRTNHVKKEWEKAREAEAEDYQRRYDEWVRYEEKRLVEEELWRWGVMRYGWREEGLKGVPGEKIYRLYKRVRAKRDTAKIGPKVTEDIDLIQEESSTYPLYRFEDEMASRVIGRAGRAYLARRRLSFLRRDKIRVERERLERLEWEKTESNADQHLTVRLTSVNVPAKDYFFAAAGDVVDDPYIEGEYDAPCDDHLELWIGFLLDVRTPAREADSISIGPGNPPKGMKLAVTTAATTSPTSPGTSTSPRGKGDIRNRWEGPGPGWMRGEVYLVNPSQVVSTEGLQRYPKGTFGIRYLDTGKEIPDVPRECLRVITLTRGMRVEARFGGGPDFYPGTVVAANKKNGRVMSYTVKYEDGDVENRVKRGHIAPFPHEVATLDAITARATERALSRHRQATILRHHRSAVASAWQKRVRTAEENYLAAASVIPPTAPSPQAIASRFESYERHLDMALRSCGVRCRRGVGHPCDDTIAGDVDALACIGMIQAAWTLREETRPRVSIELKIEYTRQATRFGYFQIRTQSGELFWNSHKTGAYTRSRPRYTFEEISAVRKVQAAWAGLKRRRVFRSKLTEKSIRDLSIACINEASSLAWIGHGEEGLTIEMWLLRAGVSPAEARRVANGASKALSHKSLAANGDAKGRRSHRCADFRAWLGGGGKKAVSRACDETGRGMWAATVGGGALGRDERTSGDAKLLKLGLESVTERRRVMAMAMRENGILTLMNWFEGPSDHRTIASAIAAIEPEACKVIRRAFPGSQSRVESMAKSVASSTFPITRIQLTAWLKRHEGRPGVAQGAMADELLDVPVTSTRAAEANTYEIYRTFCKRLSVLAANMGLKGLWIAITRACSKAEDIIAADAGAPGRTIIDLSSTTSKTVGPSACDWTISGRASVTAASDKRSLAPVRDPVVPLETVVGRATGKTAGAVLRETKPKANGAVANASSRSWAHARAALVLRTDAVAVALRWSTGAKSIQVAFRGFRCRISYRPLLSRRRRAAIILQAAQRRREAFIVASNLKAERGSAWEQLWDDNTRIFYFFNKGTGESCWEEPSVPFRPMIRDRQTAALMQAWPQLERELQEAAGAEPGFCMECRMEKATHICDQCEITPRSNHHRWGDGKWNLCFVCFAELHAGKPELSTHTFTAIQPDRVDGVICSLCGEAASRRCKGIKLPYRSFVVAARMLQLARSAEGSQRQAPVSREGFGRIVAACRLPYSVTWVDAMYQVCSGEEGNRVAETRQTEDFGERGDPKNGKRMMREEFWSSFSALLDGAQDDCDDVLCSECWERVHWRGLRAKHRWEGFNAESPVCVACRHGPAERECNVCQDFLCKSCYNESHARGKKTRHTWKALLEEPLDRPRCSECSRRVGDRRCEDCTANLCNSCVTFVHPERCPHGVADFACESKTLHDQGKNTMLQSSSRPDGVGWELASSMPKLNKKQTEELFRVLELDGTELARFADDPTMRQFLDHFLGIENNNVEDATALKQARNEWTKYVQNEMNMSLACDICGKSPDTECEQCSTVYCSNTWEGNPGCFITDHKRGNRRTHSKRGYNYAKDTAMLVERSEKEHQQENEQKKCAVREAHAREKVKKKMFLKAVQERELEREERLRWEATKELRRRRRRRARAVALAPSFSPELRRKASKRGFFAALPPGIRDVPSGIGLTARKLVDTLRARATKHYSSDLSTPKWLNLYKKTKGPAEASSAAKRARTSYQ